MAFPKRLTVAKRKLARQATNARYYQRNQESITAYRRQKYRQAQAEAVKVKLERQGQKPKPIETKRQVNIATVCPQSMEGSGSSLSAEKASGIESISSSTPESTSLKSTLSVNLAANLNQARNVYRQFRFTFRRRSRRDFYLNLYDRYDDSVEEREHINTLVTGLTKLLKLMKIFASEVKNYAGRDKSQIVEVDGYIRTMESWVEAMNAFDYWASWGKETLTAELHGREGNIHHLISDI